MRGTRPRAAGPADQLGAPSRIGAAPSVNGWRRGACASLRGFGLEQPRKRKSDTVAGAATGQAGGLGGLVGSAAGGGPDPAEAGIVRGVTGVYDMTPDARPMLGEVPGRPGLIVAAGFSGMGFKISPAVGEALAELIVSGVSQVDLRPFRPGRFAEGAPISPVLAYSDN